MKKMIALLGLALLFTASPAVWAGKDEGMHPASGFFIPDGNVAKGRAAFERLKCATCHRVEKDAALNNDFNLSTDMPTTVLELAKLIWGKINGKKPFKYVCDEPFAYDVQKRVPDTRKAKKLLGFKAETSLDKALDKIIPWIKKQIEVGGI